MGVPEIIVLSLASCFLIALIVAILKAIGKTKVFGFENNKAFYRATHEIFLLFIGYIGQTKYSIDEFGATLFLCDYYKWSKKGKKYKAAHPLFNDHVLLPFFRKCASDFPLAFCISAIDQYILYGDALSDFLGFYAIRCGIHSEFGAYCSRFYSEWVNFWTSREELTEEYYKDTDELQCVKHMCARSLWEDGFLFDDVPSRIAEIEKRELLRHREIEAKYNR